MLVFHLLRQFLQLFFQFFYLSEKVGFYRWLAVIVGFIGIIVITELGFNFVKYIFYLSHNFLFGMSYVAIAIRQLSTTEPIWLIALNFSAVITLASFFTIPYGWIMPDIKDLILLSLVLEFLVVLQIYG